MKNIQMISFHTEFNKFNMKIKGIILIAFLALLLHDVNCTSLFQGCCRADKNEIDIPLANRPVTIHQNRENLPTNIKDYELLETLGTGKFSEVRKAKVKNSEYVVAIKIIDKSKLTPDEVDAIKNEAKIMEMIKHQNIIEFLKTFEDNKKKIRYIVMEYASKGTVLQYLNDNGPMNEREARDIFGQLFDAVEYLHGMKIVHRDLKPANLLINEEGVIKLADFGFATKFTQRKIVDEFPGSFPYLPLEMIDEVPYNRPMAEVWTLGVVLYELLTRELAFCPGENPRMNDLRNNVANLIFSDPPDVSSECSEFIRRFLVVEPTKRCILKNVKEEENNWLKSKTIN